MIIFFSALSLLLTFSIIKIYTPKSITSLANELTNDNDVLVSLLLLIWIIFIINKFTLDDVSFHNLLSNKIVFLLITNLNNKNIYLTILFSLLIAH